MHFKKILLVSLLLSGLAYAKQTGIGVIPPIKLPPTGVGAGSCTNCNLSFGIDGRLTLAANGSGGGGLAAPAGFAAGDIPFAASGTTLNRAAGFNYVSSVLSVPTLSTNAITSDSIQSLSGDDLYVSTLNGNSINIYPTSTINSGGVATIAGGQSTTTVGGDLRLFSGAGGSGFADGNVLLDSSHLSGAGGGSVSIGTANANAITIGRATKTASIAGNLSINGTFTTSYVNTTSSALTLGASGHTTTLNGTNVFSAGGAVTFSGQMAVATGTPTIAIGSGAPSGSTIALQAGSDNIHGTVIVSVPSTAVTPGTAGGALFTLSYSSTLLTSPKTVQVTPASANASGTFFWNQASSSSASAVVAAVGTITAPGSGTDTYSYTYFIIQ